MSSSVCTPICSHCFALLFICIKFIFTALLTATVTLVITHLELYDVTNSLDSSAGAHRHRVLEDVVWRLMPGALSQRPADLLSASFAVLTQQELLTHIQTHTHIHSLLLIARAVQLNNTSSRFTFFFGNKKNVTIETFFGGFYMEFEQIGSQKTTTKSFQLKSVFFLIENIDLISNFSIFK